MDVHKMLEQVKAGQLDIAEAEVPRTSPSLS